LSGNSTSAIHLETLTPLVIELTGGPSDRKSTPEEVFQNGLVNHLYDRILWWCDQHEVQPNLDVLVEKVFREVSIRIKASPAHSEPSDIATTDEADGKSELTERDRAVLSCIKKGDRVIVLGPPDLVGRFPGPGVVVWVGIDRIGVRMVSEFLPQAEPKALSEFLKGRTVSQAVHVRWITIVPAGAEISYDGLVWTDEGVKER
jgi:hypothetical protein